MEANGKPDTIQVKTQTVYQPVSTLAEKMPDGRIQISYVVEVGNEFVMHSYMVGKPGQDQIQSALTGITIAGPEDIPNA